MMSAVSGAMNIVLAGDNASFLQAMQLAEARMAKLTGTVRQFGPAATTSFNQAEASMTRFGHGSVSSVQAASAALREMNGNFTNNIRAVERLIAMSPALSSALKFAFPVFGVAAGIGMAVEGIQKLSAAMKEIAGTSQRITDGFRAMHSAAQQENNALAVTNDKLANEIAKLEKKPQNSLQLSLDEARQSADKLSDSLSKDLQKATELLEKNKIGFWGQVMGQAGTAGSADIVKDVQGQIDAIRAQYQQTIDDAVDIGGASKQNIVDIKTAEMVRLEKVYADAHARIKPILKSMLDDQYDYDRSGGGLGRNQKANISILGGFDRELSDQEKSIGGQFGEDQQTSALNDLNAHKGDGDAQRKAAEAQMKQMESANAALKLQFADDHASMVGAELGFWESMSQAAEKYPDNLRVVQEKIASATEAYWSEMNRLAAQGVAAQKKAAEESAADFRRLDEAMQKDQREIHRVADAQVQLASVMARANDAIAEQQVSHDEATGSISRYAAAVQTARLHLAAYQEQINALKQEQADDDADASMDPAQRAANQTRRQAQIVQLQMEQQRTGQQDQWNIQGASPLGGVAQAFAEIIRQSNDLASTFKQLTTSTIADFNKTLMDVLSTRGYQHRGAWRNLGKSTAMNVGNSALKFGEGQLLGAFGGGQLGSRSNPMWTRSTDFAGLPSGSQSGLSSTVPQLISSAAMTAGGMGSTLGGLAKTLFAGIPFFADGVSGFGGGLALVGEKGPELVNLPGGTDVIPNHKMADLGGGDTHTWNIDARGSTDPALTAHLVRQGIAAAAPHIIAASVHANNEYSKRGPATRQMS